VISNSIVFHLVVILPQIILGGIAAARTDWSWRRAQPLQDGGTSLREV
jgi:hypothetical protein